VELSEYVLEPLRKDEEFILYRGQHRNQVDAGSSNEWEATELFPPTFAS